MYTFEIEMLKRKYNLKEKYLLIHKVKSRMNNSDPA